jgi:hypothetical protein
MIFDSQNLTYKTTLGIDEVIIGFFIGVSP